jgi:hypothetical protein
VLTVSNTSSTNALTTTVNGVTGTGVPIINTNVLSLSGTSLTSTVNGVTSAAVNLAALDSNIYTANGTLTGARTVTMGSNNLTFAATSGNLIFNPSSAGFVGIGTASPDCLFSNTASNTLGADANGISTSSINWAIGAGGYTTALYNSSTATNAQGLAVKIAGTSSANRLLDLSTGTTQYTPGTSVMVVQGNGLVGIGTVSPAATLDVENSSVSQFNIIAHFLAPSNTTAGNITQLRVGVAASTYNSAELRFQYNGSSSISNFVQLGLYGTAGLTVNGSGNVGIGTASPTNALTIVATSNPLYLGGLQSGANTDSTLSVLNG